MPSPEFSHSWQLTPSEAVQLQKDLSARVVLQPLEKPVRFIAGGDISFNLYSNTVYAGFIVLSFPELKPVEASSVQTEVEFPYVPGLLSFRESPALLKAWEGLSMSPDLVVLDGQGIAHPRRLGIASHFGILTGYPSLGCAKSLLTGKYEEPALEAGSMSDIMSKGEKIGVALRTKKKVKPVFISPGHKITFDESVDICLRCVRKYRIPEPTRFAHILVNKVRRGEMEPGLKKFAEDEAL